MKRKSGAHKEPVAEAAQEPAEDGRPKRVRKQVERIRSSELRSSEMRSAIKMSPTNPAREEKHDSNRPGRGRSNFIARPSQDKRVKRRLDKDREVVVLICFCGLSQVRKMTVDGVAS
jgi:hypothetical protein